MSTHKQLPDGWQLVSFGDVAREVSASTRNPIKDGLERYVGLEHLDPDSLSIKRWGLIEEDNPTFTKIFRKGQVLFGRRRAYQRKAAVAEFDGICSGDIIVMEAKPEKLLPDLFPFIVQSGGFFDYAIHTSAGSLSPRTKWSHLMTYQFPLPPLDEQHRIAEILWALEETINHFTQCRQVASTAKNRLFNELLAEIKSNNDVQLADVCTIQNGLVVPTQEPYRSMIHIAPDDIESDTGRILERNTAAEDDVSSANYLFSEDAILYSKIRPNLRKVALVDFKGVCSADVYPIYPKPNILRNFLYLLLLSPKFTSYAIVRSIRSAIPKINRDDLLKYTFHLPSIIEQEQIADRMNIFEVNIQNIDSHIQQLSDLKRKVLGELLVAGD